MSFRTVFGRINNDYEEIKIEMFPVSTQTGNICNIDYGNGCTKFTPTENYSFSFSEIPPSGYGVFHYLFLFNGGLYTPTWPTITWITSDGLPPTLKTSGLNIIQLAYIDGGLYGFFAN